MTRFRVSVVGLTVLAGDSRLSIPGEGRQLVKGLSGNGPKATVRLLNRLTNDPEHGESIGKVSPVQAMGSSPLIGLSNGTSRLDRALGVAS